MVKFLLLFRISYYETIHCLNSLQKAIIYQKKNVHISTDQQLSITSIQNKSLCLDPTIDDNNTSDIYVYARNSLK